MKKAFLLIHLIIMLGCSGKRPLDSNFKVKCNCPIMATNPLDKFLLQNSKEDTILQFWNFAEYISPTSMAEVNLNSNELRYYIFDTEKNPNHDKRNIGWFNSINENVMIRFFDFDSIKINLNQLTGELSQNQIIDSVFDGTINTAFEVKTIIHGRSNCYSFPLKLVNKSYTDSLIKFIFTSISATEACSYLYSTYVGEYHNDSVLIREVFPKLKNKNNYLIDSSELHPKNRRDWIFR